MSIPPRYAEKENAPSAQAQPTTGLQAASGSQFPNYNSTASIIALLKQEGLAASKRFGQNFLVNPRARQRCLGALSPLAGEAIWEIGAGLGAMTAMLVEKGCAVTAFEIDHGFVRVLDKMFAGVSGFEIVVGDFIEKWHVHHAAHGFPHKIFGNLPYSSAAAIIASLMESHAQLPPMVFLVQKEIAQRMCASPGTKMYSSFSVLCSSVSTTTILFDIESSSFWPVPHVGSVVVSVIPHEQLSHGRDCHRFSIFVRAVFGSRRKTLFNNIKANSHSLPGKCGFAAPDTNGNRKMAGAGASASASAAVGAAAIEANIPLEMRALEILAAMGKSPQVRAEELSAHEFGLLFDGLLGSSN